jgi:trypsin
VDKPQALENFPIARIVGGTTAVRGEFPAFVQIWIDGIEIGGTPDLIYPFCGASLIQSNKVLTAAHCTNDFSTGNLYALPEFYSFNDSITFSDLIPVATKAVHSNFNDSILDSDVSVLTLSSHSGTALTSVYGGSDQLTGDSATVVGTGLLSQVGSSPDTLQKVTVPIVSNSVCETSYGAAAITGNMMCAGLSGGGNDSCQGGSGGPLWVNVNGKTTQTGIVSWGVGCATLIMTCAGPFLVFAGDME